MKKATTGTKGTTAKATKTNASTAAPKKAAPAKSTTSKTEQELDAKNAAKAKEQKVEYQKELKYLYPEDVTDARKRKTFRQRVRAKLSRFDKRIAKSKTPADRKQIKAEKAKYESTIYPA